MNIEKQLYLYISAIVIVFALVVLESKYEHAVEATKPRVCDLLLGPTCYRKTDGHGRFVPFNAEDQSYMTSTLCPKCDADDVSQKEGK